MAKQSACLEQLAIASPCTAEWDAMIGDERVRFCEQCQLNVYNLSEMSRKEAEALVYQTEGKRCVRFYRREDGTLLTRDCPYGLKAMSRKLLRVASLVLAALLGVLSPLIPTAQAETRLTPGFPATGWEPMNPVTMGDIRLPYDPIYNGPPPMEPVEPGTDSTMPQVNPDDRTNPSANPKIEGIQPFIRFQTLMACQCQDKNQPDRVTTDALGEEGGPNDPPSVTTAIGEEGREPIDQPITTLAIGEEGQPPIHRPDLSK